MVERIVIFAAEGIKAEFVQAIKRVRSDAEAVFLPRLGGIEGEVSRHTDAALCVLDDVVVCAPEMFENVSPFADAVCGLSVPYSPYPNDVAYNAAAVGKCLFCAEKYTDAEVLSQARRLGMDIVNVRQGYAKCSTVSVSKNALITSDAGIAKAAVRFGLDVLKVTNDGVRLDGFGCGFIGGASCRIPCPDGDVIVFTGDIDAFLPDAAAIRSFCAAHGVRVVSCEGDVYDYGQSDAAVIYGDVRKKR